jgi:hypothetical protein
MKRFITLSLLTALYTFSLSQSAYAIFCSNCSQFVTQIPQYATELITKGATFGTQINTFLTQNKLLVLDPIANGLIAASVLKQQSQTINLVTGALGGGDALLQINPEKWIKDQGLNVVQVSLSDITGQKGIYSDSLFSSVVSSFKASNSPLETTLASLGGSTIPKTVQTNLCSDDALTRVAKNDVMRNDGTFDAAALAERKRTIYNSLCVGNPATDKQLATRLQQVSSQRPDIGGWDTWLAITNGDNAYNKSVQATLVISKAAEEKKAAAKDDLSRGGGVVSPRKCDPGQQVQKAPNGDPVLNISDALCRATTLTNTGSAVSASFQSALNAPLERLLGSFGSGILSTLSSLLSARNSIALLTNAFGGATGGSSGGGTNTSVTVTSSSTPTQDLVNNPEGKKALTDPTLLRIDTYLTYLDKLAQQDSNLLAEVAIAETAAASIQGCYERLMEDFNIDRQYPGIDEAFSYRTNRVEALASFRTMVGNDTAAIASARTFIAETKTKINASNSSDEIGALYDAFEAKIANGTFPTDSAHFQREAEYQTLRGENQIEELEGGTSFRLRGQCTQIRQQLTPREAA